MRSRGIIRELGLFYRASLHEPCFNLVNNFTTLLFMLKLTCFVLLLFSGDNIKINPAVFVECAVVDESCNFVAASCVLFASYFVFNTGTHSAVSRNCRKIFSSLLPKFALSTNLFNHRSHLKSLAKLSLNLVQSWVKN